MREVEVPCEWRRDELCEVEERALGQSLADAIKALLNEFEQVGAMSEAAFL